jgi:lysophospholipase L1-like esterase
MNKGKTRIIHNLLLLAASIGLSLLGAEFILRVTTHRSEIRVGTTHVPKAKLYGWAPLPDSKDVLVNPDTREKTVFVTNSQGWKDVEHSLTKPDDVIRILFIGDSFTFGVVPLEDLYTRQVEKKLKEQGISKIEVISIGAGCWGTDQELEALKLEGVGYKPDIVVYQFCLNDLTDNLRPWEGMPVSGTTEIFLYKPFRYELRNGCLQRISLRSQAKRHQISKRRRIKDFLMKSALFYNLYRWKILALYHSWFKNQPRLTESPLDPEKDLLVFCRLTGRTPQIQKAWDLLEALVLEMKTVCHENVAGFLIFPEWGDAGLRTRFLERHRIQTDCESDFIVVKDKRYNVDMYQPLKDLEKICQRNSIPLIKPKRVYERYQNDGHTNKTGNENMARDIVDFLLSWEYFNMIVHERAVESSGQSEQA